MKMLPATAFSLVCMLVASAQAQDIPTVPTIPTNCNVPQDVARDCTAALASAFTGMAESFCSGNCPQRYANALTSCGSAGTQFARLLQQGCGRNSQNQYCLSFYTQSPPTTQCQSIGCCANATLAAPLFTNCPTTEPCTAPFSLSGDGGNTNGGGSNMNGGSPSINSMATMFTSFLLATVALLFHS